MRTTIRMQEDLLTAAKVYAAKVGMSLTALIEEGLRFRMKMHLKRKNPKKISLPTFRGSGLQTKINLSSNVELQDFMDPS